MTGRWCTRSAASMASRRRATGARPAPGKQPSSLAQGRLAVPLACAPRQHRHTQERGTNIHVGTTYYVHCQQAEQGVRCVGMTQAGEATLCTLRERTGGAAHVGFLTCGGQCAKAPKLIATVQEGRRPAGHREEAAQQRARARRRVRPGVQARGARHPAAPPAGAPCPALHCPALPRPAQPRARTLCAPAALLPQEGCRTHWAAPVERTGLLLSGALGCSCQ